MIPENYYFSLCQDSEWGTLSVIISPIYYFESRHILNDDIDRDILKILPKYLERNSANEWCVADKINKDSVFCDMRSLGFVINKKFNKYLKEDIIPERVNIY